MAYDEDLKGILLFRTLAEAEKAICRLEELRRRYLAVSDSKGVESCRNLALLGRKRAESIGRNPRVRPAKRQEKAEIARWFAIWLETPELFADWLALRKQSGSFRELNAAECRDTDAS
jgi:hypothetical protein